MRACFLCLRRRRFRLSPQTPGLGLTVGGMAVLFSLLLSLPARAQDQGGQEERYRIDNESKRIRGPYQRDADGKLVYDVTFQIKTTNPDTPAGEMQDTVVIRENDREAHRFELHQVSARNLTAVLAMDVSGSMARKSQSGKTKMEEAREAALLFLDRLHPKADTGLILFDHALKLQRPPVLDPERVPDNRQQVAQEIERAVPDGGTAYLDACHEALMMLKDVEGSRAVVLMTDGVDINSQRRVDEVVELSNRLDIPVYVLGVGDPGWEEAVSTVLVLDQSKSMEARAGSDEKTKMEALHDAASRFVGLMPPTAQAALLPFSSRVKRPDDFTNDQERLRRRIHDLTPVGGTSFYDATLAGIETLAAARPLGKRYVVALTDGVDEDPGSRHDPEEIIARAQEENVALFMLALGRKEEVNEAVMRQMADSTGGKYFHAENQQKLFEIFESLSLDIHGDAIDEEALKSLAARTRGRYYQAADASELKLIYLEVAEELQSTYTVTFPSLNQKRDGTVSAIDILIFDSKGRRVSNVVETDVARPGLVVPEIDYRTYLLLLALLLVLLYVPSGMKRLAGSASGRG